MSTLSSLQAGSGGQGWEVFDPANPSVPSHGPYCEACGRHFTCSTSLRRHLKIHTGAKPHACLHCAFSCNRLSNLRRHMTRHHDLLAARDPPEEPDETPDDTSSLD
ncbi:Zinc finger protein 296 [Chionoecetes opilio]|uniref:Zinc finger protein 296 n=1 Tax=Chionoecetes opilio TaxID=41210 RepID=A0A8J4YAD3_CHIOP|nr:Zinc finger protein 296 [Chionoecetes opilio]